MATDAGTDYHKYLKFNKDDNADLFRMKSDRKLVWYNPDPKEKDTYASAEVISENNGEIVIKTEIGEVRVSQSSFALMQCLP